jgi:hypothetical protein
MIQDYFFREYDALLSITKRVFSGAEFLKIEETKSLAERAKM